ncbi:hypothetical protein NA57DRAFT_60096 [Rhizodiscina lignyota]|uniref:Uncharacterized protein n=1 Tax=Rhizodiscina lignyota TaxID=1504668 RepID=A0A9P4M2L6_9PEZI|nr:hypothetical protein NA57DRAFT_60096 [Rhizodiscina lignyota]
MSSAATPKVALISGHTDLTEKEFNQIYIPLLGKALEEGHHFILGDAQGVDTLALAYLQQEPLKAKFPDVNQRITIFASRKHNVSKLESLGVKVLAPDDSILIASASKPEVKELIGIENSGRDAARYRHLVRDTLMTMNSDYDILFVRSEGESRVLYGDRWRPRVSATEMNQRRRLKLRSRSSHVGDVHINNS